MHFLLKGLKNIGSSGRTGWAGAVRAQNESGPHGGVPVDEDMLSIEK